MKIQIRKRFFFQFNFYPVIDYFLNSWLQVWLVESKREKIQRVGVSGLVCPFTVRPCLIVSPFCRWFYQHTEKEKKSILFLIRFSSRQYLFSLFLSFFFLRFDFPCSYTEHGHAQLLPRENLITSRGMNQRTLAKLLGPTAVIPFFSISYQRANGITNRTACCFASLVFLFTRAFRSSRSV